MRISDWSSDVCSSDLESEAYGIFGSLNYAFDNGLTLQAGARYNHDTRDFVASRPVETRPDFVVNPNTPVPPQAAKVKEIGRASCRARVCQYVSVAVGAVSLKKKNNNNNIQIRR